MPASPDESFVALQRFGLGARPGDLAAIAGDPRGAVLAEIGPDTALISDISLPDTLAALNSIRAIQMCRREARKAGEATQPDSPGEMTDDPMMAMEPGERPPSKKREPNRKKKAAGNGQGGNPLTVEIAARLATARAAQIGFAERWAMFWSNHFAVEAGSNQIVRWVAGPYDREAIRPRIFGRFEDLLFAATQHPAMLRYLNNATSIGPQSPTGLKRDKGLNENHARELMELHTIGVDAAYTQADVTALANILTGWSFGSNPDQADRYGRFRFNVASHEPGAQTLLGDIYEQKGVRQGESALRMLASHPATATHIATKLVRHFVADAPPDDLIGIVAAAFTDTGGDLGEVARALVGMDAAWAAPATKIRLPQEYLLAAVRALNISPKAAQINKAIASMGQPFFDPPSPEGFHDDTATWLAPDAMTNRLDFAQLLATQADASADARAVADSILGPAQSPATREAVARAEGPVQGLAILLMSPEFQRR